MKDILGLKESAIIIQEADGDTLEYMPAKKAVESYSQKLLDLCEHIHQVNCEKFPKLIKFLKEHHSLVDILLEASTTKDAVLALQRDLNFAQTLLECSGLPLISDMLPLPSIDACLQMKDRLAISDNGWREVMEPTLKLPKGLRIHSIRKYRHTQAHIPNPTSSGYSYYIREIIHHAIRTENIPEGASIQVKLSLDAGQMIKGSRLQLECCLMDIIKYESTDKHASKSTSAAKSFKNAYLISLFRPPPGENNPETNDHIKTQLSEHVIKFVNKLVAQPTIEINDEQNRAKYYYNIEFVLCCDMKCLTEMLGMYNFQLFSI